MWYAATTVPDDAAALPVAVATAKARLRITFDYDDALLADLLREAASVVAGYCNIRLLPQTLTARCDGFADFSRLPDGPVIDGGISEIRYIDAVGFGQTLDAAAYEARRNGFDCAIIAKGGRSWPVHRSNQLITVVYQAGFEGDLPFEIQAAILLHVEAKYKGEDAPPTGDWTAFDSLLVGYRRGA